MTEELLREMLSSNRTLDPPGCVSAFVEHPNPEVRGKRAIEIGSVIEHRFAFVYWIRLKQALLSRVGKEAAVDNGDFDPPDLVTWDWHNDVGITSDYDTEQLGSLDQSRENEVALFAWAKLRKQNDGHIAPALWLNAVGDVYVIQKQIQSCKRENHALTDRFGNTHRVFFFRTPRHFSSTFARCYRGSGVVWDIDLDFFTAGHKPADRAFAPTLSSETIFGLLDPQEPWLTPILRDLNGITIALEPTYTGGLSKSLEIYNLWEKALFTSPVSDARCRWRAIVTGSLR